MLHGHLQALALIPAQEQAALPGLDGLLLKAAPATTRVVQIEPGPMPTFATAPVIGSAAGQAPVRDIAAPESLLAHRYSPSVIPAKSSTPMISETVVKPAPTTARPSAPLGSTYRC